MNTFQGINEFEKLYLASPVPKEIQNQWLLRKNTETDGKFPLSSSLCKPVTKKVAIHGQKARLLQRMQGRSLTSVNHRSPERNELINGSENIPKESLSALEFGTNTTSISLCDKLSVTLPEWSNIVHAKTSRKELLTISNHECSPVKLGIHESKVETPVLKGKINNILSNLSVSDTEDETPSKLSQREVWSSPRKDALYFDGKSSCDSEAADDEYSSQESCPPGAGRVTSEVDNTYSSCADSENTVEESDSGVGARPKAHHPPSEPKQKKSFVPLEKEKTKTKTISITGKGNTSKPVLNDTRTSHRSTCSIAKDESKHVLNQWIIKPLCQSRGICVEGHKSGDPEENFWHSSEIVKRIDNKTVLTSSGTLYKLVGDIKEHDALEAGFPRSLVKKFKDGFPHGWEKLIENFYLRKEKKKTVEVQNATFAGVKPEKLRLGLRRRTCEPKFNSILEVPSPVLEDLPRTRSGRMVKPLLAFWAGQRVRVHNKTGRVEITAVESPVLDRSDTQPRQSKPDTVIDGQKLKSASKTNSVVIGKKNNTRTRKSGDKRGRSVDAWKRQCYTESVVVLTDINKENSHRPKSDRPQQTNKRVSPAHGLNVEADVLNVIHQHKLKRLSQRKGPSLKTCYSKAGEQFSSDSSDVDSDHGAGRTAPEQASSLSDTAATVTIPPPLSGMMDQQGGTKTSRQNSGQERNQQDRTGSDDVCQAGQQPQSNDLCGTRTARAKSLRENQHVQSSYRTRSSERKQTHKQCDASSPIELSDSSPGKSNSEQRNKKRKRETGLKRKLSSKEDHYSQESSSEEHKKPRDKGNRKFARDKARLPLTRSSDQELEDRESGSETTATTVRLTRSNTRKNKKTTCVPMAGSPDMSSDPRYKPSKTSQRSNLKSKIKERTVAKKGNGESAVNSNTWTKKETNALYRAVKKHSPDNPNFWMMVSAAVLTKTREECHEFYFRSAETDQRTAPKASKPQTKATKAVSLTGGVGTLKRKRELRELLEQHNEGYEDDYFDSTPMRKQPARAPMFDEDDDDDIFGDKLPFDTPAASRTPFLKHVEPVSTRKTPHMGGETPSYSKSVNRKEMDRYIHRLKKRRRITPELTNHKNKKEAVSNYVEYNDELFSKEHVSECDSEEETDYYWSDDLG